MRNLIRYGLAPLADGRGLRGSRFAPHAAHEGSRRGSSHAEAPAISDDPTMDNTDVWGPGRTRPRRSRYVTGLERPLERRRAGPNYRKVDPNFPRASTRSTSTPTTTAIEDLTYQFRFSHVQQSGQSFLRADEPSRAAPAATAA